MQAPNTHFRRIFRTLSSQLGTQAKFNYNPIGGDDSRSVILSHFFSSAMLEVRSKTNLAIVSATRHHQEGYYCCTINSHRFLALLFVLLAALRQ